MSLYKTYKNDLNTEVNGIKLELGENSHGQEMYMMIARAGGGNQRFLAQVSAISKKNRRLSSLSVTEDRKIVIELYAKTVVVGWGGITDENDNVLEFNVDNVIKVLTDLPDLFQEIVRISNDETGYRKSLLDDAAKN